MPTPMVVFARLASGSVCHYWQSLHIPQSDAAIATAPLQQKTPRNAKSGRDKVAFCRERVPHAQHSLPPHPDSHTIMIAKQHPYLRCRLTSADGCVTGL